jgi:hypothetical protein
MKELTGKWQGSEILRPYLVSIGDLRDGPGGASGDPARIKQALVESGQVRPVLVAENGVDVVARQHLLTAARELGWTHIAVRLKVAEELVESADQMTFLDAPSDGGVSKELVEALGARKGEADDEEIDEINAASKDADHEWVGLPEFLPATESYKVVISCETEEDRDALFDVLGIATIHKGTRGTLSVWWPDRAKKDLASLRFVVDREESRS